MQQQSQPSAEAPYLLQHLLLEKMVKACGACPVCFHLFIAKVRQVLLQIVFVHKHTSSISHRHLQPHYCHAEEWVWLQNICCSSLCKPILADDRADVMIGQQKDKIGSQQQCASLSAWLMSDRQRYGHPICKAGCSMSVPLEVMRPDVCMRTPWTMFATWTCHIA